MSSNDLYALGIEERLREIPKQAAVRMAKRAFRTVIQLTYQDSGQAAFNWHFSINSGSTAEPFDYVRDPQTEPSVGDRGDKRTLSELTFIVARKKIEDFEAQLNSTKTLRSIMIYNNINFRYAKRAHIERATEAANNPGAFEKEIADTIRESGF